MSPIANDSPKGPVSWRALLDEAITKPGYIHEAYSRFHRYSLGNRLLALWQCAARDIEPGPLATFQAWKALGRNVKRGEKALCLSMPLPVKKSQTKTRDDGSEQEITRSFTRFTYQNRWFTLSQTEGEPYQPGPQPDWDEEAALQSLQIHRAEFRLLDGNCQGYAKQGSIVAVSPIAALPYKTLFHEMAHVLLRHTEEGDLSDTERTPKNVKEVEAESVALICCEALGLAGAEYCRGYIQSWSGGEEINDRSAQRIFHAADQILRAGSDLCVEQEHSREADLPSAGQKLETVQPDR